MTRTWWAVSLGLLVLLTLPPGGVEIAYGGAGPAGVTFYANSPAGGASGTALRKFVDSMPGLGPANANNLGQYIPIAVPDTTTYPGSDYYQLGIVEYTKKLHTDLPKATKLRGYVDLGTGGPSTPHYGGPLIVAQRDRPVRVLFINQLPTGAAGNLFLPVDITLMGAGTGPLGPVGGYYTHNRTSIHLHGGFTPWISDGTPHQWFTPAGETTPYTRGVSYQNVPDMPLPPDGATTLYFPNQQSARLMFYHDHALAITRLNVYAGMVAPYIIHDPVEDDLIDGTNNTGVNPELKKIIPDNGGGVYKWGIPLIIQDKTFVPQDIAVQDSKWDTVNWGTYGDLWYPHIYEANQSLTDPSGMNPYGRWDYGPWVQPNILAPVDPNPPVKIKAVDPMPGTDVDHPENYLTCTVPEAFNDVMMVNGTVYPYLVVEPRAYRFRILNGCNDRFLNLQLYLDASGGGSGATAEAVIDTNPNSPTYGQITAINVTNGGFGYVRPPGINITGGDGFGAFAEAVISGGVVTAINILDPGHDYTSPPTITIGATTEVKMVPAVPNSRYPRTWPKDGRDGGVPDPATAGPSFIMIGNEGGFLPSVAVMPNQPVNYDYDRGSATFGNVLNTGGGVTVFLGPAERADVIVDFSGVPPGTNVILYNDAPAPVPGFQPRYDYYTGNPDQTAMGGWYQTQVGIGPNTRTIMQFRVQGTPAPPFDLAALEAALPQAYVLTQPPPIIPQTYYPGPYQAAVDTHGRINDTAFTFKPVGSNVSRTIEVQQKSIVEIFDRYGRLQSSLGLEFFEPNANPARSNGVGFAYIDPPDEVLHDGEIQIWKITHNGVDTHPVHVHLVNAQLINRVGWDGVIKPPEPFERGWKETIRMNPLESIFIALKAELPKVPFAIPVSVRPLNPAQPLGSTMGFTNINPKTGQPLNPTPTVNVLANFGHEYVWHCHILAHEENDMMRPLVVTGLVPTGSLEILLLD